MSYVFSIFLDIFFLIVSPGIGICVVGLIKLFIKLFFYLSPFPMDLKFPSSPPPLPSVVVSDEIFWPIGKTGVDNLKGMLKDLEKEPITNEVRHIDVEDLPS